MWTIPNLLTYLRILVIPIFVLCFYLPFKGHSWVCAFLFLLAASTDWLDGFLARFLKQTSRFGEFLDPVADKLIIAAALVLLVSKYATALIAIPGIVIVCREISISALREWMAEIGKSVTVKVSTIGKWKTAIQMVAITILLIQINHRSFNFLTVVGIILMYVSVVLTLWSMYVYVAAASHFLVVDKSETKIQKDSTNKSAVKQQTPKKKK
ncbi:MAG: CDP-diacylglycerol--glycerol-3-phosphate 3-phosphatidyltransferase [Thiotrichales bacterium]|nr:MAG: CDP-diacylglycerol--glycerol-3-phosphate 3-phosphatidyltransferase [Thiotrichales bacterium]